MKPSGLGENAVIDTPLLALAQQFWAMIRMSETGFVTLPIPDVQARDKIAPTLVDSVEADLSCVA